MSKTIEELASEYYLNEVINGDTCDDMDGWTDCFVSGAEALMQLPLASRLTAEEKERVRHLYKCAMEIAQFYQQEAMFRINLKRRIGYEASRDIAKGEVSMLEILFGTDFFKEDKL